MVEPHREIASFIASAEWASGLVAKVPDSSLEAPGLGDWSLRSLIGHTSRSLLTVEQYSAEPADRVDVTGAEEYYERVGRISGADPVQVLQRGVDAGIALGADPATEFAAIAERVVGLVSAPGFDERVIVTIAGGMRLRDYLPTRTFELIVHGHDIARAAGLDPRPPRDGLAETLRLVSSLAMRSGRGSELVLALTGRTSLPEGFTVLP